MVGIPLGTLASAYDEQPRAQATPKEGIPLTQMTRDPIVEAKTRKETLH
jgi:hypothetical protein